jgi:hypothetical protein
MEMARPGDIWQTEQAERSVVRKLLDGKALFTGLMHLYAAIYREMVGSVQTDHRDKQQNDAHEGFKE